MEKRNKKELVLNEKKSKFQNISFSLKKVFSPKTTQATDLEAKEEVYDELLSDGTYLRKVVLSDNDVENTPAFSEENYLPKRVNDDTYFAQEKQRLVAHKKKLKQREISHVFKQLTAEADSTTDLGKAGSSQETFSLTRLNQKRVTINKHWFSMLPKWFYELQFFFVALLLTLVLYVIINSFYGVITIYSDTMSPTLLKQERVVLEYRNAKQKNYQRGDIVLLDSSAFSKNIKSPFLVQRIIAVPGDSVEIKDGAVYINGDKLAENYLPEGTTTELATLKYQKVILGERSYFTLLDQRNFAFDSRTFGIVPQTAIKGRIIFSFWPFGSLRKEVNYDKE